MALPIDEFFAAPFALDGELLGVGRWQASTLSPKWLEVCSRFLHDHGPSFRASMGQTLSHIEFKLTSAGGAGLGIFYARGEIVISTAYMRGVDDVAEREMAKLFVESLRKSPVVQSAKSCDLPFEAITTLQERPLHVVVVWANPNVSDDDFQLVKELSNHFAAAFLLPR